MASLFGQALIEAYHSRLPIRFEEAANHKERRLYSASRLRKIRNGHQNGLDRHGMGPLSAKNAYFNFLRWRTLSVRNTTTNYAQSLGLP